MMRRLLQEQSDRVEEMHRHQRAEDRAEVKRTIETAIAQHVQHLNTVIAQERTSRVQAISEIQQQINSLQAEDQRQHGSKSSS